ncbi:MAG: hypothetical protein M1471_00495 [Patescibacteria group bacterium]|nr:hypothetical protein [Patescibacteria group bacterium]
MEAHEFDLNDFEKKLSIVDGAGIVLQEFLSILDGKKPAMVFGLGDESFKEKIETAFPGIYIRFSKNQPFLPRLICGVALDENKAAEAAEYLSMNPDDQGVVLGYPKCCVTSHMRFVIESQALNAPLVTYNSFKNSQSLNYLTNNIFNFYSRIGYQEKNMLDYARYGESNINLPINTINFQYISHIPCRYDCEASVAWGKITEGLMKKYTPNVEAIIKNTLARPILFVDLFEWIVFDGKVSDGVLSYNGILPPKAFPDEGLMKAVLEGNRLKVDDQRIEVFNDDRLIISIPKKDERNGFLMDFSVKE